MLILEIAAGVFLGGLFLWLIGILRNQRNINAEGQMGERKRKSEELLPESKANMTSSHQSIEASKHHASPEVAPDSDRLAQRAIRYYTGDGVTQSYSEALKNFRQAADQGHIFSINSLAHMLHDGEGVEVNHQEAFRLYQITANQGDPYGQAMLGQMYEKGEGVSQDLDQAYKLFCSAARQRNDIAMLHLGRMYLYGEGATESHVLGRMWLRLASANGSTAADEILRMVDEVIPQVAIQHSETLVQQAIASNYTDFRWEFTEASAEEIVKLSDHMDRAEAGDPAAQAMIGLKYYEGNLLPQDYAKAAEWLTKSAEQGFIDAKHVLANMYLNGLGVHQNHEKALGLWIEAAESGYSACYYNLGLMYAQGKGTTADMHKALHWTQLAAARV